MYVALVSFLGSILIGTLNVPYRPVQIAKEEIQRSLGSPPSTAFLLKCINSRQNNEKQVTKSHNAHPAINNEFQARLKFKSSVPRYSGFTWPLLLPMGRISFCVSILKRYFNFALFIAGISACAHYALQYVQLHPRVCLPQCGCASFV